MSRVAVIGAGVMGNGIAHVFAQYGWDTALIDVWRDALDKALKTIETNLERQVKKGVGSGEWAVQTLGRIRTSTSLDGAANAELFVEAATERPEVKFDLFRRLDRAAPAGAILATNTSSIPITSIAAQTQRPAQVIGMHFMNPAPLMQLVEVIRGLDTSDATTQRVVAVAKPPNNTPLQAHHSPGIVSNRVLLPMINHAIFCALEGVAPPAPIHTAIHPR